VSRYGYDCPAGHEVILDATMRRAPDQIVCLEHDADAPRRFEPPQFTEDRLHFRRTGPGAPAENWSWTLGGPMPTSRAERKRVERERGIEFVTPSEARADAQKLRDGKDLWTAPKPEKGWLAKEVRKRGIKLHPDSSGTPARLPSREESERKIADRGWNEAESVTLKNPAP
jgi:hypothetical protein